MKKKLIRTLALIVVLMTITSTVAFAACPCCQETRVSHCGAPYTTTQHTKICATCNTTYKENHRWVTENITYCSLCGYYW